MAQIFDDEPTIPVDRPSQSKEPAKESAPEWVRDLPIDTGHELGLQIYQNPLLNAASELISYLISLSRVTTPENGEQVRQTLIDKLVAFRQQGLFLDYHPSVIDKSCFVLAAALDEVILHSEWGEALSWENESLLSRIFNQRDGGEVFFDLLEQAKLQPSKLVDFLELQYIILCTGFLGRYRAVENVGSTSEIARYKAELYDLIQHFRPPPVMTASSESQRIPFRPPKKRQFLKTWFIAAIILMTSGWITSWFFYQHEEAELVEAFRPLTQTARPGLKQAGPPFVTDGMTSAATMMLHKKGLSALESPQTPPSQTQTVQIPLDKPTPAKKPTPKPKAATPKPKKIAQPLPTRNAAVSSRIQSTANWEVVAGTFKRQENLLELQDQLQKLGYQTSISRQKQFYILAVLVDGPVSNAKSVQKHLNDTFKLGAFIREKQ
ncbi:Uncharacterised protein [BD1-7 clade bacterium]|uniref:Type IV / VI secretion system DotU domain-containing protein n=1 Tax=BD1-7 clade bacterium TaxID=2029982 RepID=A0A5S9N329_9GAMM|nr:Uncharacterised protein [BD1-7 clade bacterium]